MKKTPTYKTTFIISAIFVLASATLFALTLNTSNKEEINSREYSYTKAICEGDSCQDYVIVCNGSKVLSKEPITGASITIPTNWEDPRPQEIADGFCNLSD